MQGYEYKVVPAPKRGLKAKGVKGTDARFANALQSVMNDLGAEGWEYQRADTLPCEERQGLTGRSTTFQNMLVFRRSVDPVEASVDPLALIEDQRQEVGPADEDALTDDAHDDAYDADLEEELAALDDELDAQEAEKAATREDHLSDEARERISASLRTPFVMPWKRRKTDNRADDDPSHAAE